MWIIKFSCIFVADMFHGFTWQNYSQWKKGNLVLSPRNKYVFQYLVQLKSGNILINPVLYNPLTPLSVALWTNSIHFTYYICRDMTDRFGFKNWHYVIDFKFFYQTGAIRLGFPTQLYCWIYWWKIWNKKSYDQKTVVKKIKTQIE